MAACKHSDLAVTTVTTVTNVSTVLQVLEFVYTVFSGKKCFGHSGLNCADAAGIVALFLHVTAS